MNDEHVPVMADEAIRALAIEPDGKYVDCTFGRGGHSRLILDRLDEAGGLLAFDRDPDARNSRNANMLLEDRRFSFESKAFSCLQERVAEHGWLAQVNGVLLDIGLSSPQLDNPSRGFSFQKDGILDMRMDTTTGMAAREWIAGVDESDLAGVLRRYGEERFARRIARAIVDARSAGQIGTTNHLATVIEQAVPVRERHRHPATRSFQAIRIYLNDELGELQRVLEQAVNVLKPGGRVVVICFHSLEDRIVKRFFRSESRGGDYPAGLPVKACDFNPRLRVVGKAVRPGDGEVEQNSRARSAVMRVAERVS